MILILGQTTQSPEDAVEVTPDEQLTQVAFEVRLNEDMTDTEKSAICEMHNNPKLEIPLVFRNPNGSVSYYFKLKEPLKIDDCAPLEKMLYPYLEKFGANIYAIVYSLAKDATIEFFLVPVHSCEISDDGKTIVVPDLSNLQR